MSEYLKLTLVENDKTLFVRKQYISGAFENEHPGRTETVLNMTSGAFYRVKERAQDIMAFLDPQNEPNETTDKSQVNGGLTEISMYLNTEIDMTTITDSMQLDSNQVIASMQIDGMEASLEVRGDVKVWWNEKAGDPTEGELFTDPSEFPDQLKRLIANGYTSDDGHWTNDPRLWIENNNWFEIFVGPIGTCAPSADLVDAEGSTPKDLFELLYDAIKDYKE